MRSQNRLLRAVATLMIGGALLVACGAPADETEGGAAPTSAKGGAGLGGLGGKLPPPDPTAKLDPETKKICDAVWSVNVFAYATRVTAELTAEERDRFRKGLDEYEPEATVAAPTLKAEIKALAAHARAVISGTGTAAMTPELTAANQRVVDYLRNVCKFQMS